jgi:hypothetical protein
MAGEKGTSSILVALDLTEQRSPAYFNAFGVLYLPRFIIIKVRDYAFQHLLKY